MPILDAIARQGRIRFVPSRSEAGAMNMADAYARVSRSLGVLVPLTGTVAGNAAGSQVEALTAGSPVLHITSQIDRPFMDRDRAAIHDVPRQADMLKAVSKAYFRVWEGRTAVGRWKPRRALRSPRRAVRCHSKFRSTCSVSASRGEHIGIGPIVPQPVDAKVLDALADLVCQAKRPMLWLGGGAREAIAPARDLADRGFAVVTSTNGRAVVPEAHRHTLGAYNMTPEAQAIFDRADSWPARGCAATKRAITWTRLPRPLVRSTRTRRKPRATFRSISSSMPTQQLR